MNDTMTSKARRQLYLIIKRGLYNVCRRSIAYQRSIDPKEKNGQIQTERFIKKRNTTPTQKDNCQASLATLDISVVVIFIEVHGRYLFFLAGRDVSDRHHRSSINVLPQVNADGGRINMKK